MRELTEIEADSIAGGDEGSGGATLGYELGYALGKAQAWLTDHLCSWTGNC